MSCSRRSAAIVFGPRSNASTIAVAGKAYDHD